MASNQVILVMNGEPSDLIAVKQRPGTHLVELLVLEDVGLLLSVDGMQLPLEEGNVLEVESLGDAPPGAGDLSPPEAADADTAAPKIVAELEICNGGDSAILRIGRRRQDDLADRPLGPRRQRDPRPLAAG